jgi:hypothetical protein
MLEAFLEEHPIQFLAGYGPRVLGLAESGAFSRPLNK